MIGVMGSLVHIAKEQAAIWKTESFLEAFVVPFSQVVKDFGMLPAFMLSLSVYANISNWMIWLGYAGSAYGRVCDIALVLGGVDALRNEGPVRFRFYRYLNTLHYLCFHSVDPRFGNDPVAICKALAQAGLLTEDEALHLGQATEMHSTVLIWLSRLWDEHVAPKLGAGQQPKTQNFTDQITALRTYIGSVKAQVDFGPPDITRGMLYAVTYT